jgi:electron transfer flavoprotein alpha subunit
MRWTMIDPMTARRVRAEPPVRSGPDLMVHQGEPVDLESAEVVVAIGAGVRSDADFRLVAELAEALGAAIAGTRPAVDRGFIKHEQMIGQTGRTVRPSLYIAVGISGSMQHRTGVARSAKVVAINSDPKAPIFSVADHAIIGDLQDVIPKMIAAVRAGATVEQIVQSTAKV